METFQNTKTDLENILYEKRLKRLGLLSSEKNKGDRIKVHEVMSSTDRSGTSLLPVSYYRIKGPSLNYQTKGGTFKTKKKKQNTLPHKYTTGDYNGELLCCGTSKASMLKTKGCRKKMAYQRRYMRHLKVYEKKSASACLTSALCTTLCCPPWAIYGSAPSL